MPVPFSPVPFSPVPVSPVPIIVALWRGNLDKVLETVNPFPEGISHRARRQFRPSRPTGRPRAVPPPPSRSAAPAFLPPSPLPPAAAIPCVWTARWRQMRRAGLPRPGPRPDPPAPRLSSARFRRHQNARGSGLRPAQPGPGRSPVKRWRIWPNLSLRLICLVTY